MILQETNNKYFNLPFTTVLSQDSVLLARLFVKYFRNQGFFVEVNHWENDLSAKYGGDNSYRQKNWQSDSFNNGVKFKLKDNNEDKYNNGFIQIGLNDGYAFLVIRYLKQGKKYKISINKTVREFIEDVLDKYKALKSGQPDENELGAGTTEKSLEKLFSKKGFDSRYCKDSNTFYIKTNDLQRVVSEKTYNFIMKYYQNNDNYIKNLATKETIDDFIIIAKYVVKRMKQLGYTYDSKNSSFYYNCLDTVSLRFYLESDSNKIQEKYQHFEDSIEKLQNAEAINRYEFADLHCRKIILDLFTDDWKFVSIAKILDF